MNIVIAPSGISPRPSHPWAASIHVLGITTAKKASTPRIESKGSKILALISRPKGASLAGVGPSGTVYVVLREGDLQKVGRYQLK